MCLSANQTESPSVHVLHTRMDSIVPMILLLCTIHKSSGYRAPTTTEMLLMIGSPRSCVLMPYSVFQCVYPVYIQSLLRETLICSTQGPQRGEHSPQEAPQLLPCVWERHRQHSRPDAVSELLTPLCQSVIQ